MTPHLFSETETDTILLALCDHYLSAIQDEETKPEELENQLIRSIIKCLLLKFSKRFDFKKYEKIMIHLEAHEMIILKLSLFAFVEENQLGINFTQQTTANQLLDTLD